MNQSENNLKITLRGRKLRSTIHFPLKSALLYIRHLHVERSAAAAKSLQSCPQKQKQLMDVNDHVLTQPDMDCSPQQAPLSMGFSIQDYWSGLSCLPPGDLPSAGIEPWSPALQQILYPLSHQGSHKIISDCLQFVEGPHLCLLRIYDHGERHMQLTASCCSPMGLNPLSCVGTRDLRSWFVFLARQLLWETSTDVLAV